MLNHRIATTVTALGTFVLCVLIWALGVRVAGVSNDVLPGPWPTLISGWELVRSGELLQHSVASLYRVTVGFYLAALVGLPLGMILGASRTAQRIFSPLVEFLRPISPLAWIPLAMIWFGIGDKPAIFLIFLASFFTILVPTMAAVTEIPSTYFLVARNFSFSSVETLRWVVFPAILPRVLPALRVSVGIAWLVVVAAEMIAVKSGLGFLILDARNALRMDRVLCAMLAIGTIGIVLNAMMNRVGESPSVAWARSQ